MSYKPSKYHAKKTTVDGITFDSRKEAKRYQELKLLQRAGKISDLQLQVEFELIPTMYTHIRSGEIVYKCIYDHMPRKKQKNYKLLERKCSYKADFVYRNENGREIVEDVKGVRTEVYKLKKKLMLERYGIKIIEK